MNIWYLILGIAGSIASIVSVLFGFITFINPMKRLSWFMLKHPHKWEKRFMEDGVAEQWVYKPNPSYQLIMGEKEVENFHESWVPSLPDKKNNFSFKYFIVVNGARVDYQMFVCLDGARYTVPLPHKNKDGFYYNKLQLQIGKIVEDFSSGRWSSLEEFSKENGISILSK